MNLKLSDTIYYSNSPASLYTRFGEVACSLPWGREFQVIEMRREESAGSGGFTNHYYLSQVKATPLKVLLKTALLATVIFPIMGCIFKSVHRGFSEFSIYLPKESIPKNQPSRKLILGFSVAP